MLLCPKIRPSAVQARGFAMERCLSNLARDAGFDVKYTERDVAKPNQLTDITILDYPVGNNYKERKESLGKLAKKRAQRAKNKAERRQPAEERPPPLTNSHLRIDAVVTWGQSESSAPRDTGGPPGRLRKRGALTRTQEKEKRREHEEAVKPDRFAPAAIEAFGCLGPALRNVLRVIAETATYQSAMDIGLDENSHKFLIGAHLGYYYGDVSCALQKAVAAQLRFSANMILSARAVGRRSGTNLVHDYILLARRPHAYLGDV
jgi:hypothetical protein